ncbi:acyl-CoA dehydrogenase family protein [Polyangium mundeleinium]|uniref:Acyl-CoA dehydrogenase family protein n=1 Tax=Polyangium mundeleinium TaxID=2995306 RepID=A0ABT5EH01_9BACT|nr:acyl-CoA dehydrogenase family protein [Polyangium mundeleinium]MDC0741105.1 acyl-CoA dehydrogenase family protein [Polyangium mundeleinium]
MNFDLTPDQKLLESTMASFLKKESPVTRFRALREDPVGYDKSLWKTMAELGWIGLAFPESAGGLGGSFVDVAILLEQFGAGLVPEPFVASVLSAGTAILRAGSAEQHEAYLAPLIAGDTTLALAWAERGGRYDPTWVETTATKKDDAYVLQGEKIFVQNGHAADVLVVSARTAGTPGDTDGISLFVLPRETEGLRVTPVNTMDGQKAAMITLAGVVVPAANRLGPEGAAAPVLDEIMDLGAAAACAEGLGVMRASLAMTVDYLKTREQFGMKIGTFQALQHRAVDMFIRTELAKSTSILASVKVSDPDPAERRFAVSAAKVELAICGRYVTQQALQLHGGIGITDEHDIGLYFKRMHVLNALFGDEEHHLARFAAQPAF